MRTRTKLLIYAGASVFLLALTFAFDFVGMMAIDFAGFNGFGAEFLKVIFLIVGSAAALVLGLPLLRSIIRRLRRRRRRPTES
jgi:hypothetical protein